MDTNKLSTFKAKALQWAASFEQCCCLDSNAYPDRYAAYDFLLAAGSKRIISAKALNLSQLGSAQHDQAFEAPQEGAFEKLRAFRAAAEKGWLFGVLGYELKDEVENLSSRHADRLGFPDLYFFEPEYLLAIRNAEPEVLIGPATLLDEINAVILAESTDLPALEIQAGMGKETYLAKVEELRQHIQRGDIYELNFCQEFYAESAVLNPTDLYKRLKDCSPTPFAAYFKAEQMHILSASPERYLAKRGQRVFSQPIKGTAKRGLDLASDEQLKEALRNNSKERAENVMIVDLVRNDMTHCALPGTVQVEELCGIYTFPQVHQMISTVSCLLDPVYDPVDMIRATFPMGSMTGAPKIKAMELIEETELSRRAAYSGAIGYLSPGDDFDFNVLIRSLFYAADREYLSFQVGSAITYASSAEAEYEECLLKASAIMRVLSAEG